MISIKRPGMLGRRLWPIGLMGAVVAVAAAGPSAAQQQLPAIDSKADPDAAAAAIQAGGSASNITWQTDTDKGGCEGSQPAPATPVQPEPCVPAQNNQRHYTIVNKLGPPAVFGDVLYNCSQSAPAESDTGTSLAHTETWSLSEKVSLKISGGLPGIVEVSAEVSAFSTQSNAAAQTVTIQRGVGVAPGWKGWETTRVNTMAVSGTASVTDPIRNTITPVQDIDWSFPGYADAPGQQGSSTTITVQMTAKEINTICDGDPVELAAHGARVVGSGLTVRRPNTFALRVCGPSGRCGARTVTGSRAPSRVRQAAARLTRGGRVYGRGTYTRGHTQLHLSRALRPGRYRLTLRESSKRDGAARHTIKTILRVSVPARAAA
jgi:hypothetical protein